MHPTADAEAVIYTNQPGRRVTRDVIRLRLWEHKGDKG